MFVGYEEQTKTHVLPKYTKFFQQIFACPFPVPGTRLAAGDPVLNKTENRTPGPRGAQRETVDTWAVGRTLKLEHLFKISEREREKKEIWW